MKGKFVDTNTIHNGLSRRSMMAASAAFLPAAALTGGAAMAADADAELLALGEQWQANTDEFDRRSRAFDERNQRRRDAEPPKPEALRIRPGDRRLLLDWMDLSQEEIKDGYFDISAEHLKRKPCTRQKVEYFRTGTWEKISHKETAGGTAFEDFVIWLQGEETDLIAQARADEITAAWDQWRADCRAAWPIETNPPKPIDEALDDERVRLEEAILALPATTWAGLQVKARVASDGAPLWIRHALASDMLASMFTDLGVTIEGEA